MDVTGRWAAGLALAWAVAVGVSASAQQTSADPYGIDPLFERFTKPDTPGCAVGVAQNGRPVIERAYGLADLEHSVPNTPRTRFEAGSVSKQFTAAAILLLAEEGKLKLTDDARRFIPELPDYGASITIENLLNHTSGLRDWTSLFSHAGMPRGRHVYSNANILDITRRQRALNHAPGEEYSYTNTGYSLMALIVERVTGQSFLAFTRERIFVPLGMNSSEWRNDFRRVVKDRATAYDPADGTYVQNMPFEEAYGSGALITTVGDLTIWNDALANDRLGARLTKQLQVPGVLNDGRAITYARGLQVQRYRDATEISHSGATAAYRAWLARYPDQQLSIAVLCNVSDAPVISIGHAIAALLLRVPQRDAPDASAIAAVAGLADKAGLFVDTRSGFPMRLTVEGGSLKLSTKVLEQVAADRFRDAGGEIVFRSPDAFSYVSLQGPTREYRRETTPKLAPDDLAPFTGRFFSEELGATYEVIVRAGAVAMERERWPDVVLKLVPLYRDAFEFDEGLVRFQRADDGRTTSLSISDHGARDIIFVRFNSRRRGSGDAPPNQRATGGSEP